VSLDSGHGVSKHCDDGREDSLMEIFLEFFCHIIRNLSDAMNGSVSNLWNWVMEVLQNSGDHWGNFIYGIDVFTDLGQSHKTGILVSPVCLVSKSVCN
jgi:hypothetical protein